MTIRVVIADDERAARTRLTRLLGELGDARVVAECADGASTLAAVETECPDVLLLDVEMPEGGGFAVAKAVVTRESAGRPLLIFVTAFDQYAVRAFEVHAMDYVLKPVSAERLAMAWERVRARLAEGANGGGTGETARVLAAIEDLRRGRERPSYRERILVTTDGRTTILRTSDLEWIEAAGNYVRLHAGAVRELLREGLASLESQLDPSTFVRVHRGAIVNLDCIREIQPWFSGDQIIILKSGARLKLSRTYRKVFEERLGVRPG
jgi:two-component system LytT family response regulator